ncbi:MAG: DNA polymerase IV [SAR202 cluster bacterium]|nr:DNA polymerase IV [SAR202 cluster bacterium]
MRHILHADLDAFYASVEQRDNPKLRGKPVVVGGNPDGRGVVAAASYEVRKFGVRSAMPMKTAMRLCPKAIRVPPRFDVYQQVSRQIMAIFRDVTPLVEPLSLDEAYLDVTSLVTPERPPQAIAASIKQRVRQETGLTITIGVATSKSVAKVASGMNKPDGLTVVPSGTERAFLAPLPAGKLWGVGPKTAERLAAEGVKTIGDLAARPDEWARKRFGKTGPFMLRLAQGHDDRPVSTEWVRKSMSAETTLEHDSDDPERLEEIVTRLSQRVSRHLRSEGLRGHTVKLKLRLSDFTTFTRQKTLSELIDSPEDIAVEAMSIMRNEMEPGRKFRLLGVGVSGFEDEDEAPHDTPLQLRLAGFE